MATDPPSKKKPLTKASYKTSAGSSSAKVMNGHVYDTKDVKAFYDKMLSSPEYKKRLLNNGYGLDNPDEGILKTKLNTFLERPNYQEYKVDQLIKNRREGVRNVEIQDTHNKSTHFNRNGIVNPYVNLNAGQLNGLKVHPRTALVHEVGHAETDGWYGTSISGYEKEMFKKTAKPNDKIRTDDGHYVKDPEEAKSDINTIRYNLYKAGDFNPSTGEYKTKDKKFNKDLIPKIKNDYSLKRMLDAYGEEGVSTLMNTIANNKQKNTMQYMANGGLVRPSSRQRYIAPAVLIGAGLGLFGKGAAQKQQKKALAKQEQDALRMQYMDQKRSDAATFNEQDIYGNSNVEYYANGGEVNPDENFSPEQTAILMQNLKQGGGKMPNLPVSNGGYQTKGGNLVPIGDGVELAVGNRHNDTKIDGVSGIQLSQQGETVAEIEDKEVIVDGDKVLSDRLKFDKKNSYADKMVQLTKKRNKLESQQEKATSKRTKNTIDRKLAGLNMAEETLFKVQEAHKEKEGMQVLQNTFAIGGRLNDPTPPFIGNKYKGWRKNVNGYYVHPTNPNIVVNEAGMPMYNYEKAGTTPGLLSADNTSTKGIMTASQQSSIPPINVPPAPSTVGIQPAANPAPAFATTPATAAVSTLVATTNTGTDAANTAKPGAGIGASFLSAIPMLIDNIGNFFLTKNTPKPNTPLLNRVTPLETRVNINPQLAELRRTQKTNTDNILHNTSNSNNAKNNIIASALGTTRQANELIGGKENQELSLRNANVQNMQMTENQNNAVMNQHNTTMYQRANDINSQYSANLANLAGDIKSMQQRNDAKENFRGYTMANLMDDKLGEKAHLYALSDEFMADPKQRSFIMNLSEQKDANGNYTDMAEKVRLSLKQKGLLK